MYSKVDWQEGGFRNGLSLSEDMVRVLDWVGLRVGHDWRFQKEQPAPLPHNGVVKKICFKVGRFGSD